MATFHPAFLLRSPFARKRLAWRDFLAIKESACWRLARHRELDREQNRKHKHRRLRLGEFAGDDLHHRIGDEAQPDAG